MVVNVILTLCISAMQPQSMQATQRKKHVIDTILHDMCCNSLRSICKTLQEMARLQQAGDQVRSNRGHMLRNIKAPRQRLPKRLPAIANTPLLRQSHFPIDLALCLHTQLVSMAHLVFQS